MKTKKCAFTGHRPKSIPFGFNEADERCIALKQKLRNEIIRQIEENGVTHFITGMAIGVDMFAAEIVLGLKSAYNGITLECAIPCETQAEKWSEALRNRYFDIASKCDKETLLQQRYTPCKNRHPSPICTRFEHHLAGVLAPLSRTEATKPYNWFSTAKL